VIVTEIVRIEERASKASVEEDRLPEALGGGVIGPTIAAVGRRWRKNRGRQT
jgi:hypothetical protein